MWGNWFVILAVFSSLLIPTTLPVQQSGAIIADGGVTYQFGQTVNFKATVQPADAYQEVFLYIQQVGLNTQVEQVNVTGGAINFNYDVQQNPLRPFAITTYWYEGITSSGTNDITSKFSFEYIDNRFQWQTKSDANFQVHWHEGDLIFGQQILNVANSGLEAAKAFLPVSKLTAPVQVYVYTNAADLQQALALSQQPWVAGHASADLRTVLVSIPSGPEEQLELERQVPHEIAHILQYDLVGSAYKNMPVWLLEGTASLAELYQNPDYPRVLNKAVDKQTLVPISDYCHEFPRDASGAFLAYAESSSFVRFLYENYGVTRLTLLMQKYRDGMGCEEGFLAAINTPLPQLETRWRQEVLKLDAGALAFKNLLPYLLVLALILIPPIISGLYAFRR